MKKVLRISLLLVIALVIIFGTISVLNMISVGEKSKMIAYGVGFFLIIIGMCIAFFILLGKQKKR